MMKNIFDEPKMAGNTPAQEQSRRGVVERTSEGRNTDPATGAPLKLLAGYLRSRCSQPGNDTFLADTDHDDAYQADADDYPRGADHLHFLQRLDGDVHQNAAGFHRPFTGDRGGRRRCDCYGRSVPAFGVMEDGVRSVYWLELSPAFADAPLPKLRRSESLLNLARKSGTQLLAGLHNLATPGQNIYGAKQVSNLSEQDACSAVMEYQQSLTRRCRKAEITYWEKAGGQEAIPKERRIVPNSEGATFSPGLCAKFPEAEKARKLFWLLNENAIVEWAIAKHSTWSWNQIWMGVRRNAERFRVSELMWQMQMAHFLTDKPGCQQDALVCLGGCIAALIGSQHLAPLIRMEKEATPEEISDRLLQGVMAAVLSLQPEKLTIFEYVSLATSSARSVRSLYTQVRRNPEVDVETTNVEDNNAGWKAKAYQDALPVDHPAADPLRKLLSDDVTQWVSQLPHQQQRAICLRADGYTYEEIAEKLACKMETVKEHLARGRRSVRKTAARSTKLDSADKS